MNWIDRIFKPKAKKRTEPKVKVIHHRNYDAAQHGRRTQGWNRSLGDADSINARALVELRLHARDLERNDAYASKAIDLIAGHVVGCGVNPKATTGDVKTVMDLWRAWAGTSECDAYGMMAMPGLQELAMKTTGRDGEVLLRRRFRRVEDGLTVPLQIQLLEADHLDSSKNGVIPTGKIVNGIEFNKIGQRVAYWLFPEHPGSSTNTSLAVSKRVPASEIAVMYRVDRPGQSRGVSWLATNIAPLKDFGTYEDAQLQKQQIGACFAAFVTDPDGDPEAVGDAENEDGEEDENGEVVSLEPGQVHHLEPGEEISFASPPAVVEGEFPVRTLRKIAAGLKGITYEELSNDFSRVNYSSSRAARVASRAHVWRWQWNMFVPQFCGPVWDWFIEAAMMAGLITKPSLATWTCPPLPMLEVDKEAMGIKRMVRIGAMTPDQMVAEQGLDPDQHWQDLSAQWKKIRGLGLTLDCDPAAVSDAGLTQQRAGSGASGGGGDSTASASDE
jgi:lambda family phage portal protein